MRIIKKAATLGGESLGAREELVSELTLAYQAEIETLMNYLSAGVNLRKLGVKAQEVGEALVEDVEGEMQHAQRLAERLHTLGERIPCSSMFEAKQPFLSCDNHDDVVAVIKGVMEAEKGAIARYRKIADLCGQLKDYATENLVSEIISDEEDHLREFSDFLASYQD
jgi:bacterioferritin